VQQNPYKGAPPRPWVRIGLTAPNGDSVELELVADTGNPFAIIVASEMMHQLRHQYGPGVETNFGPLVGGFLHIHVPGTRLDDTILGYAGDTVVDAVRASSNDFQGLVGLPLLRRLHYGGDADEFWIR
jgi:hypothetical protein